MRAKRKAFCKWKTFGLRKRANFFSSCKAIPIKKNFFQRTTQPTSHRTKANVQQHFSNPQCYCELAVHLLIFEKHRSCVCTAVTLSHRFKAFTPPFCRQNRFRHEPPENFCKITSGRALNRPRSPEVRKPLVCFLVLFAHAKSTKNVPFAGSFEVLQTSNQHTAVTSSHRNN